jgi:protein Mpv17
MSALWQVYKRYLSSHPLLTKATTSSVLMSLSDTTCQRYEILQARRIVAESGIELGIPDADVNLQDGCPTNVGFKGSNEKQLKHDWVRTSHLAVTGFTYSGPIGHLWYSLLERLITTQHVYMGLAARMTLDAFVFSPLAVAGYFVWRSALEGKDWQGITEKLRVKWKHATLASWQFWPAVNAINFSFVPLQFRVLYNNCLGLLWNGYLSRINGKRLAEVTHERIRNPQKFVPSKGEHISEAEQKAQKIVCLCSHCRSVRA